MLDLGNSGHSTYLIQGAGVDAESESIARGYVWWPGINASSAPTASLDRAHKAMAHINVDFAELFEDHTFFIAVDAHSCRLEVIEL